MEQEGTNESVSQSPRNYEFRHCRLYPSIPSPELSYILSLFLPLFNSIAVDSRLRILLSLSLRYQLTVSPARVMAKTDLSAIGPTESPPVRLAHCVAIRHL